ncbi:hypothetical protein DV736_g4358, partial [Chaetothyriales sp. CBS 134916]
MLILHQSGSVRVGEVVRYKLTYSPGLDRILPPPKHLYVKVKNTSAVPLRAAYLHGPYTLYVACYPVTFNPFYKHERAEEEGAPDFEPQLKAGGQWNSKLTVPDNVYKDADLSPREPNGERKSVTWIIEVASQVIFSTSAAVHFELLVGRNEKSIELGFHGIVGSRQGTPGRLEDHQQGSVSASAQPRGVFSNAAQLIIDNTESLWNTPSFPEFRNEGQITAPISQGMQQEHTQYDKQRKKQKKIHLVLLTHGLHSNLGADMLFMKESIDAAARQARLDAKKGREELRAQRAAEANDFGRDAVEDQSKSTEKGIQYLGKRFAKYVLSITYPDQPYLPIKKKTLSKSIARSFTGSSLREVAQDDPRRPIHKNSSILKDEKHLNHNLPYKITSISFIGHSLGGLIQTYAIAYIQKHSPEFFDLINPVNFIGMASPFLGLSNENPVYVKFALDFGLVGRTGQDLGLTWTPPTLARNGWGAVISGLTSTSDSQKRQPNPGAKPLLRILPTGPAHTALKRFRNRTVYSNVVNDGIVPLRTSCLLFLDWRGLERVDKARREYGLVGTVVEWGLAEVMGQNASAPKRPLPWNDLFGDGTDEIRQTESPSSELGSRVPQPEASHALDDSIQNDQSQPKPLDNPLLQHVPNTQNQSVDPDPDQGTGLWAGLVSLFRPQAGEHPSESRNHSPKNAKIYRRGQTMKHTEASNSNTTADSDTGHHPRNPLVRGSSLYSGGLEREELNAPPKTTFFESAGDVLNPPLPPREFILDPSARPRTIFHDRVYHPDDIPPPPTKPQRSFTRRATSKSSTISVQPSSDTERPASAKSDMSETGSMKIEEKIARAYHRDLSWRKVLVRLEPDAHNNMIVRRMFANAYGWPVVKHMCDTHFAYTAAAQTRDEDERNVERAEPAERAVGPEGEQVQGQIDAPAKLPAKSAHDHPFLARPQSTVDVTRAKDNVNKMHNDLKDLHMQGVKRTPSETRESRDDLSDLVSHVLVAGRITGSYSSMKSGEASASLSRLARKDSGAWSDKYVEDSESDEDDEQILLELQRAQKRGTIEEQVIPKSPNEDQALWGVAGHVVYAQKKKGDTNHDKQSAGSLADFPLHLDRRSSYDVLLAFSWAKFWIANQFNYPSSINAYLKPASSGDGNDLAVDAHLPPYLFIFFKIYPYALHGLIYNILLLDMLTSLVSKSHESHNLLRPIWSNCN